MRLLFALGSTVWTVSATAGAIALAPVSAPTLDEMGLIALAVIVGVAGAVIVRRRK